MLRILRRALDIIRENRVLYIATNAAYYGLVVLAMVYVSLNPEIQQKLIEMTEQELTSGSLSFVGKAYLSRSIIAASAVTFVFNLLVGMVAFIVIPGLIFPPFAVIVGAYRAVLWGLMLAPQGAMRLVMIPHSITLLLEGQAYILAIFGVLFSFTGFLYPERFNRSSRLDGYLEAVIKSAPVYILATLVLLVSAVYEAVEIILMMKFFS